MVDHIFLKKRQKQRRREGSLFTNKNILRLIAVSAVMLGGFLYFIGDPTTAICENGCENTHSVGTWVLGFLIIFGTIIGVAALFGSLLAIVKWSRGGSQSSFASLLDAPEDKTDNT
jgi:hypothetical protein